MYINTKIFRNSNLDPCHVFALQLIRQKDYAEPDSIMGSIDNKHYMSLEAQELITTIKQRKKDLPLWVHYRLTKKGKALMRDLEVTDVTEQSKKLAASLIALYKSYALSINKNNNKREVHELVAWYLKNTDFTSEKIYSAVSDYINETDKKYISSLSNLIFKSDNPYNSRRSLSSSKLYGLMT